MVAAVFRWRENCYDWTVIASYFNELEFQMSDLKDANQLLREGRQLEARQLTAKVLQQSPEDAEAWALMALLIDDPAQRDDCLRRVVQFAGDSELGSWARHQLGEYVPGDDAVMTSPAESQVTSEPESRPAPAEKPAPKRREQPLDQLAEFLSDDDAVSTPPAQSEIKSQPESRPAPTQKPAPKRRAQPVNPRLRVLLAIIVPVLIVFLGGWCLPLINPQLAAWLIFQLRPHTTSNLRLTSTMPPTLTTSSEHPIAPTSMLDLTQLPTVVKTIAPDPNNLPAFITQSTSLPYTYPDGTEPDTSSTKFGTSIAVEGNTLVIGAPAPSVGEVHVYTRSDASAPWARQAILNPDTPGGTQHQFGAAVAVEGNLIAVSDLSDGTVYVYERTGDTWVQQAKISAPDDPPHPQFGIKLLLVNGVLYIGASGITGSSSDPGVGGAVFVMAQRGSQSGSDWVLIQKLAVSVKTVDGFGSDFALDGDTLVVGAYLIDSAYVYHLEGGKWFQKAELRGAEPSDNHDFGYSVAISGDTIAVGAPSPLTANVAGPAYDHPGTVEVFKDTSARRDWSTTEAQTLAEPAPADTSNQYTGFGSNVELRNNILLISAPRFSPEAFNDLHAGSIYVFAQQEGHWIYKTVLAPNVAASNPQMSLSLAVEGQTVYAAWFGQQVDKEVVYLFALPLLQP